MNTAGRMAGKGYAARRFLLFFYPENVYLGGENGPIWKQLDIIIYL